MVYTGAEGAADGEASLDGDERNEPRAGEEEEVHERRVVDVVVESRHRAPAARTQRPHEQHLHHTSRQTTLTTRRRIANVPPPR